MIALLFKSALRNAWRHRLRALLTLLGLVIAVLAFGLLRTIIGAWYAGADAAAPNRLITRSSISLVFTLPIRYRDTIRAVDGVKSVSWANWFGGVYLDERNFFPQFAVGGPYLEQYPEFVVPEKQRLAFQLDRRGAIVGRKLAKRFGWKIGDVISLRGTIFPGTWSFVLRGIYHGKDQGTIEDQFLFHWDYLNERMRKQSPRWADQTGVFVVTIRQPDKAAQISQDVDKQFQNSLAETLTETEKAFQLGFVSMTETIVSAISIVSYVVILIIMAVMANTMAMSTRERTAEYATLKTLGFGPGYVAALIALESLLMCVIGAVIGIVLTFPCARFFGNLLEDFLPVFNVSWETIGRQMACALVIAFVAAVIPAWRAMRMRIVAGLRSIG